MLKYSPEDIMEDPYYYKVSDAKWLDEIIDGAVELSAENAKVKNNYNTIKWFRSFFADEEIIDFLNEEVCQYIAENDEDYMERMKARINKEAEEYLNYEDMKEEAYREYMNKGGRY
ncbi:MAG: hypothetical protein GX638_15150 [Crenarchaeota archaeon]|nr:hypothetical protein [Thermoproteota archaeon]